MSLVAVLLALRLIGRGPRSQCTAVGRTGRWNRPWRGFTPHLYCDVRRGRLGRGSGRGRDVGCVTVCLALEVLVTSSSSLMGCTRPTRGVRRSGNTLAEAMWWSVVCRLLRGCGRARRSAFGCGLPAEGGVRVRVSYQAAVWFLDCGVLVAMRILVGPGRC